MKLLGDNLQVIKKKRANSLTLDLLVALLVQMLDSIENVHQRGFIHRDIKPSNFCIGKYDDNSKIYIVDFGLAKKHLQNGVPVPQRVNTDFRGTITYASLNAHKKKDLSRRDDLWSFYFVILDFFDAKFAWKQYSDRDTVMNVKQKCMENPVDFLWNCNRHIADIMQLRQIFYHILNLKYEDQPNYQLIRMLLLDIRSCYLKNFYPQL